MQQRHDDILKKTLHVCLGLFLNGLHNCGCDLPAGLSVMRQSTGTKNCRGAWLMAQNIHSAIHAALMRGSLSARRNVYWSPKPCRVPVVFSQPRAHYRLPLPLPLVPILSKPLVEMMMSNGKIHMQALVPAGNCTQRQCIKYNNSGPSDISSIYDKLLVIWLVWPWSVNISSRFIKRNITMSSSDFLVVIIEQELLTGKPSDYITPSSLGMLSIPNFSLSHVQ